MNLIDKIDIVFKLKKEFSELGIIAFPNAGKRGDSVHVYGINNFIKLASDNQIEIISKEDDDYPFEANFKKDKYVFFIMLEDGDKEKLEKLINEREADKFIDELGAL